MSASLVGSEMCIRDSDNTVLIKGLKKVVNVKFSRNTHLIETSYDRSVSYTHLTLPTTERV
ncbi:hypothetical protein JMUB7545_27750 [Staphylococcus aureus]